MTALLDDPTYIVLLVFGLSGWIVALAVIFGYKDLIRIGFDMIPRDYVNSEIDRYKTMWREDSDPRNDKYADLLSGLQRVLTLLSAQNVASTELLQDVMTPNAPSDPELQKLRAAIASQDLPVTDTWNAEARAASIRDGERVAAEMVKAQQEGGDHAGGG